MDSEYVSMSEFVLLNISEYIPTHHNFSRKINMILIQSP